MGSSSRNAGLCRRCHKHTACFSLFHLTVVIASAQWAISSFLISHDTFRCRETALSCDTGTRQCHTTPLSYDRPGCRVTELSCDNSGVARLSVAATLPVSYDRCRVTGGECHKTVSVARHHKCRTTEGSFPWWPALRVLVFAVCVHVACTVAMLCRVAHPLVLQALNEMCLEPGHPAPPTYRVQYGCCVSGWGMAPMTTP